MASPDRPALAIERLLIEHEWVHRLARSLVADPAAADDAEQETWLAAVVRPPFRTETPRAWLGTVLRRRISNALRARRRRGRHEEGAARREGAPSAADLAARAEVHERLARAVQSLPEPYRTTILHRYIDDAPPREVARRMAVPVETVRTRTRRAIALLRQELDPKEPERRRAVAFALWALAERPAGVAPTGEACTARTAAMAIAATAILAAGAAAWIFVLPGVPRRQWNEVTTSREAGTLLAAPAGVARGGALAAAPFAPVSHALLEVRDAVTGRPVAGAAARDVALASPDAAADANGRIDLGLAAGSRHVIGVWAAGYVGWWRALAVTTSAEPQAVFLYPMAAGPGGRHLAGRVVDAAGAPVPEAVVREVDRLGRVTVARTDASGAFGLDVPWNGIPVVLLAQRAGVGAGTTTVSYLDRSASDGWEPVPAFTTLRLAPAVDAPVRIRGEGAAGLGAVARIEPATRWLGGDAPRDVTVADGTRIALAPGAWRVSLRGRGGESLTPDVFVLAGAEGLRALSLTPDTDSEDCVVLAAGDPLDGVTFDVPPRSLRTVVLDERGSVAGADVTLEPADASDPFVMRFGEFGPAHPSRRTGLSGFLTPGKRAPLGRTRSATTDADGVATIRGWVPLPARVRVRGAGVADTFHDLTDTEVAAGACELRVERGGCVDVAWPSWIRGAILERTDGPRAGDISYTTEVRGPVTVPPGRYVLRLREVTWLGSGKAPPRAGGPAGSTPTAAPEKDPMIVLHGPFDVRAGERTLVDLRSYAALRRTTLWLEVPGVPWVSALPIWGPPDVRPLEDGRVSFPGVVRTAKTRYGFAWSEPDGPLPVWHFHEVDVSTESDPAPTGEQVFDARYEDLARRLRVRNHEDVAARLCAGTGREAEAPYLDQHRVTFLVPAHSEVDVALSHLPRGSWWIAAVGPGLASTWPRRFEVDGVDTAAVTIDVKDEHVVVRASEASGKSLEALEGWRLHVRLVPLDATAAEEQTAALEREGAWFARVPAGRWRLSVLGFGPVRAGERPDRSPIEPRFETEILVEPGQHEVRVTLPAR